MPNLAKCPVAVVLLEHVAAILVVEAAIEEGLELAEILGAAGAATSIQMQVKDAQSAAEFQPSGNDQEEYTYLLMPLRL